MVKLLGLFTVALSLSVVLARPNHRQAARRSRGSHKARSCAAGSDGGDSSVSNDSGSVNAGNSTIAVESVTTTTKGTKHHTKTTTTALSSTATGSTSSSSNDTSSNTGSSSGSSGTGGGGGNGLFPANGPVIAGWTLASDSAPKGIQSIQFDSNTFILEKDAKALTHPVVSASGKMAMHAHFMQGSYELKTDPSILGGFSFYSPGPAASGSSPVVDLPSLHATEVSFAYSVMFSAGFQWNKGGKLPGLYGGENADVAATCSGGRHADNCFSTRLMWRADGAGQLYLYIPPSANRANICGSDGTSQCTGPDAGVTYGATIGTGNFHFTAGQWTTVREVIHLNTPGQKDGWAAVYVNGGDSPAIYVDQISYGAQDINYFYGQEMQTFFGGHTTDWASPQNQDIWFADFSLAVMETK